MKIKRLIVGGGLLFASGVLHAAGGAVSIMEILFLNDGQTTEQAEAYFYKMGIVAKRHKAKPIAGMHLKKWLKGGNNRIYNADYVVGTEFPSQAAMNNMLQKDADYAGLLFERDTIFNSEMSIVFLVDSMAPD